MIKVENIDTWGFEHAIRGMRNPKNSWEKSDSYWDGDVMYLYDFYVGPKDLELMHKLYSAGTEHRKYLRQIFVSMDITAPLYWWKEFDTYKVGTVSNSCSTMHKIAAKPFELSDFSWEHLTCQGVIEEPRALNDWDSVGCLAHIIEVLNYYRDHYISHPESKIYWWQMIQLLPSSYNQRRTITMNYENVFTILRQRRGHKLDEWNTLCDIFETLPYVKEIGGLNE